MALIAGACGSSDNDNAGSKSTTTDDVKVPKGGTLVIGAEQEPDCMDWIGTCSGSSWGYWMVTVNTMPRAFDILKSADGDYSYKHNSLLTAEPKLETSPVQTVTYDINPKAVWNDGTPITSTDFKYTWDQIANGADVYDKTGYDLIEKVDDTDKATAVVTFKSGQNYSDWKGLFTGNYGIFPSHLLQGKDRDAEMKDGYKFSGGPWILEAWNKTDNITLVPNPNFWGTKPNLDKVIFKVQADTSAEFTAFKSGQVSAIYPQPQLDAVDQINAGLPGTKKDINAKTGNFEALWLNNAVAPFDDLAVRKAVAYAVDRAAIVQRLFGALGVKAPLNDLNATVVSQFTDPQAFAKYKLDLGMVDKTLTGAGWAKGSDGVYAKGGQKLAFKVRTTAGNKRRETTQQILQTQFKAAGMEMSVDNLKAGDLFGKALPTGDFQAAIYANVLTTLGPSTCNLFCTKNSNDIGQSGGNNYTRTRIPALDEQLLKMDGELDDDALVTEGKAASNISAENMISLPIDPLPTILLWNSKVVGPIADNALLGPWWNLNTWGVTS
ncbi:MAG: peptide ABC transporter substrate-binding protein [Actinobacteria bacterium]|nr:peptide ABC transporter substrate-binding protein [Actinomycetota bacterium]